MTAQPQEYRYLKFVRFRDLVTWSVQAILQPQQSYNDTFALVKIADVLVRNKDEILVQNNVLYKRVTIRLYNKGITIRDEVYGKTIGTKKQFIVKQGQFLLSKIDARNGAFGLAPEEIDNAIVTADFLAYNANEHLIKSEFLNLLTTTNHFHNICQQSSSGTTGRQRINEQKFLDFTIPLPPLDVQERLVTAYNKLLHEAEQCEHEANATEQAIERYIMETLGIEITQTARKKGLQFVRFKDLERWSVDFLFSSKAQQSKKYPSEPLINLCKIGSGGTPLRSNARYFGGNIFWVKTGEVREEIIYETEEKITSIGLENSSAKIYPIGSLIVAMYGATAGRSAKLGINAATNQACAVVHFINEQKIVTDFLWIFLQSQINTLKSLAGGSAQPNLNAQIVGNFLIPLPPLDIQAEIVHTVSGMKSRIKELRSKAEALRREAKEAFEKELFL
jgi:type I restriction enzyme S subunit